MIKYKERQQLEEFALDRFGKRFKDLSQSEQGQVILYGNNKKELSYILRGGKYV